MDMNLGSKSRLPTEAMASIGGALGRRPNQNNPAPWGLISFYSSQEQPWVPLISAGSEPHRGNHVVPSDIQRSGNPSDAFNGWRSAQPSECGTMPQGYIASDSGYESRAKHDEISVYDDVDRSQDTQSLSGQMFEMNFMMHGDSYTRDTPIVREQSWMQSSLVSVAQNGAAGKQLKCPDCHAPCKTKSELNKHHQRHRKAHKCEVPGCSRKEGFGTLNDLDRHKTSVHPELFSIGQRFRCHIGPCATKDKIWPRADNFRQHLKRVHQRTVSPDDDLGEFLMQSPQKPQEPVLHTVQDDLSGVGSIAFNADPSGSWEEDVELPQTMDMEDFVIDPSLAESATNMPLSASPMDMTIPKPQLPEQAAKENPRDHPHAPYASIQSHHRYVQPREISRPAAKTSTMSRTDLCSNGLRANQSQISTGLRKSIGGEVSSHQDNNLHEMPEDSTAGGMERDSLPKNSGSDEPKAINRESKVQERFTQKAIQEDLHLGQTTLTSQSSIQHLGELGVRKFLDQLPKEFIEKYLKEQSDNAAPKPATAPNNATEPQYHCPTDGCMKSFNRKCELKKHMKRHDKPYGCTFTGCTKKFGSKNDWKRHENSQHFQLEVWKCDENRTDDDSSSQTCGKVCHRRETFRNHLQKEHKMEDPGRVDKALESSRVGRNCDARFWCGFCVKIIDITKKGANAWTERFNHIDNHYTGRDNESKKDISEWKNVDPDLPEMDLTGSPDDSSDADSSDEAAVSRKTAGPGRSANAESRKRGPADDDEQPEPKRPKNQTPVQRWSCCKCGMDADIKLHEGCVGCCHMRCNGCEEVVNWVRR